MAQGSSWAGRAGPSRGGRRRLTPFDVASLWGWDPSVAGCGILEDGPWSQDQATKACAAGVGTALLSLWVLSRTVARSRRSGSSEDTPPTIGTAKELATMNAPTRRLKAAATRQGVGDSLAVVPFVGAGGRRRWASRSTTRAAIT